jgi:hypothetical protein
LICDAETYSSGTALSAMMISTPANIVGNGTPCAAVAVTFGKAPKAAASEPGATADE